MNKICILNKTLLKKKFHYVLPIAVSLIVITSSFFQFAMAETSDEANAAKVTKSSVTQQQLAISGPSSLAKDAVNFGLKNNLIKNVDENYCYQDNITEYEFADLVTTLYEKIKNKTIAVSNKEKISTFVNTGNVDLLPMIKSYKIGVFQGVKVFGNRIQANPKAYISYEEVADMIIRLLKALNLKISSNQTAMNNIVFNDYTFISNWELENVKLAYLNGYLQIDQNGNINPSKKCSKEMAISILYKIITKYKINFNVAKPVAAQKASADAQKSANVQKPVVTPKPASGQKTSSIQKPPTTTAQKSSTAEKSSATQKATLPKPTPSKSAVTQKNSKKK